MKPEIIDGQWCYLSSTVFTPLTIFINLDLVVKSKSKGEWAMSRLFGLFLSLIIVSVNSHAIEPVMDQQGMFYFNMTFDAGQSTKVEHDFGFRLDRTLMQPGESMTMNQLAAKPAVFNLKLNKYGLKSIKLNGVDYTETYYAYRAAEGEDAPAEAVDATVAEAEVQATPEVTAEPEKKVDTTTSPELLKIPLGVIIGLLIGSVALAAGGR
jgi:hypothetical protein